VQARLNARKLSDADLAVPVVSTTSLLVGEFDSSHLQAYAYLFDRAFNFLRDSDAAQSSYGAETFTRLLALKREYDPDQRVPTESEHRSERHG
jgi:hypothetical protein